MDLPFAVDSPLNDLQESDASLITASSQGSLLQSDEPDLYAHQQQQHSIIQHDGFGGQSIIEPDVEVIDFTQYVTVNETDANEVDIVIDIGEPPPDEPTNQGDVLELLLSGTGGEQVVCQCEQANKASQLASEAKRSGDLAGALQHHSLAAKLLRDAGVDCREKDMALSDSLLLLSQSQAKSALALKEFLKLQGNNAIISSALTQKERLQATVRDALVTKKEPDISDSMFLGKATSNRPSSTTTSVPYRDEILSEDPAPSTAPNPVDEMMELERELKEMDSALELGNSVSSLGTRTQNRLKNSTMDGSFMVVPPGTSNANSYMSSSAMWSRPSTPARPSKAKNRLEASQTATSHSIIAPPPHMNRVPSSSTLGASATNTGGGLDASWWGNASSTTSQVLAGSVCSIASRTESTSSGTNTKQLMSLLESIKTLGDENAALLREVEDAEAARVAAKAAKEQMKRFKADYTKRFNSLKAALEKFRTQYPNANNNSSSPNPVANSDYVHSHDRATREDQLLRQEQLIRKLTADLRKEKDDSRKKDAALKKYESFYREVKARSAVKAAQRKEEAAAAKRARTLGGSAR